MTKACQDLLVRVWMDKLALCEAMGVCLPAELTFIQAQPLAKCVRAVGGGVVLGAQCLSGGLQGP